MKKMVYYTYNERMYRKATTEDIKLAKKIYKLCSTSGNKTEVFHSENPKVVINVIGALYFRYDDNTSNDWYSLGVNSITVKTKIFQKLMVRNTAVLTEIKRIVKVLGLKKMPDNKARVVAIHDYLCNFDEYDHDDNNVAFTIYDSLVTGKAICSGYAMALKAMCDYLDIECDFLTNHNHAWNRVRINGQYLYIDTTWDDKGDSSQISRKYFLISEEEFKNIHPWHEKVNDGIWQI